MHTALPDGAIVLAAGAGRAYDMPAMRAVFKADGDETGARYSVSEWWLKPQGTGPGAHSHADNDEIFLVLAGTAHFLLGDGWIKAGTGTFLRIPAGVTHDFENWTDRPVGLFNVFIPGGFEQNMPAIVKWYEDNPA